MSWWKRPLVPVALAALFALSALSALPAHAQVSGRPFEVGAGVGVTGFDSRDYIQDGPAFAGSLAWRWKEFLSLEYSFTGTKTKMDLPGEADHQWSYNAFDLRWNLRDPAEHVTPYLITGVGVGRSLTAGSEAHLMGAPNLGVGLLYNLFGRPRTYLRLQAKDVLFREQNALEFSHHISATAGIQFVLGGRYKDQDVDGVRNWLDKCPNTTLGAKVNASGCTTDADGDSVADGIDKCDGTPRGCKVDKNGCIIDADGDGVCDGLDKCPDTPKGAKVDSTGCPLDTDGDGVYDGLDQCPDSTKGCLVDKNGCHTDADQDGVCDGLDQCPNTPAGTAVNSRGCPIQVGAMESDLLETGTIRLQTITFDTDKATLKPESDAPLTEVAKILLQYPTLTIEIGGHTDGAGNRDKNMRLSEARAKAVLAWFTGRYPMLDASKFSVKGYGPTVPVASNNSALGKSKNRRIEFKSTNPAELKAERDKRGPTN